MDLEYFLRSKCTVCRAINSGAVTGRARRMARHHDHNHGTRQNDRHERDITPEPPEHRATNYLELLSPSSEVLVLGDRTTIGNISRICKARGHKYVGLAFSSLFRSGDRSMARKINIKSRKFDGSLCVGSLPWLVGTKKPKKQKRLDLIFQTLKESLVSNDSRSIFQFASRSKKEIRDIEDRASQAGFNKGTTVFDGMDDMETRSLVLLVDPARKRPSSFSGFPTTPRHLDLPLFR